MVQSVFRAIRIMEQIQGNRNEQMGLTEISRALNLKKPTVFNIVRTLQEQDYLENDGETNKYRLGKRIFQLARGALLEDHLRETLLPHCRALVEEAQENATIVMYRDAQCKTICRVLHSNPVTGANPGSLPFFTTASGRCLLAALNDSALQRIVEIYGYPGSHWDNTDSWDGLVQKLSQIRSRKLVTVISPEREVAAVGALIDSSPALPPVAFGFFLPAYRFIGKRRGRVISVAREYQRKLSLLLGELDFGHRGSR